MASRAGRMLRIIVGGVLIFIGLFVVKNTAGYIISVIGIVPLLAGVFDVCILAPLFSMPFIGKAIRAYKSKQ